VPPWLTHTHTHTHTERERERDSFGPVILLAQPAELIIVLNVLENIVDAISQLLFYLDLASNKTIAYRIETKGNFLCKIIQ